MSFEAQQIAIEQRLRDNWLTTPIDYPNSGYQPQNDVPFIRLAVINGDANQVDWGKPTNTYRHVGIIVNQILVPINAGTGLAYSYVDSLAAIWRSARFGGIVCLAPRSQEIGEVSGWFQINLSTDFRRDDIF